MHILKSENIFVLFFSPLLQPVQPFISWSLVTFLLLMSVLVSTNSTHYHYRNIDNDNFIKRLISGLPCVPNVGILDSDNYFTNRYKYFFF